MSRPVTLSDELWKCLESVDTEAGRLRVAQYLNTQPYPHYEPAPDHPGLLIRIEEDGSRTRGRFVGREFRVSERLPSRTSIEPSAGDEP